MLNDLIPPIAAKIPHGVYFGVNPHNREEFRGNNAMDPPLSINDEYYWLRDDKRENEDVLNYLKLENEYYAANMSSSEQLVDKLYDKMLLNLKQIMFLI